MVSGHNNILVVLGYPANDDGQPSPILKARLDKAIELFRDGIAEKIILTGAAVENQHVESHVMANYCKKNGVPGEKILIESDAKNTYENAKMVHNIMQAEGYQHAIVVTSSFHTMRAQEFFSRYVKNVTVVPAPFPAKFPVVKQWFLLLKEHLIITLYKAGLLNNHYSIQQS